MIWKHSTMASERGSSKKMGSTHFIAANWLTLLQEKEGLLDRFSDHFNQLLNVPGPLDTAAEEEQRETYSYRVGGGAYG